MGMDYANSCAAHRQGIFSLQDMAKIKNHNNHWDTYVASYEKSQ